MTQADIDYDAALKFCEEHRLRPECAYDNGEVFMVMFRGDQYLEYLEFEKALTARVIDGQQLPAALN